jgi:xylulokinase
VRAGGARRAGRDGRDGQAGRSGDDWVLGVDIGTGSVKALAVTLDGRPLATSCVEHPMHHPRPGWAENDPDDWLRGVVGAVRQIVAADGVDPGAVAGMCVVSQRDPWVLLDADDQPLRASIAWTDQRSEADLAEFAGRMGRPWLIDRTGVLPIAGLGLPTLLWIQRHDPKAWSSTRRLLSPKDYVLFRLTGLVGTDVSTPARSVMNDLRTDGWSAEICSAAGIALDLLPEVIWQPWQRVAELNADAASLLGLPPGVPVAAGGGDDPSAALGAGAVDIDDLCAGTGTSSDWRLVVGAGEPDTELARGDVARHVVADRYLFEVCIESTGSSLRWFRDAFGGGASYAELVEEARSVPPGADGLVFLPFVDGAKRAPWYLDGAAGGFFGIASGHTRAHMARALLEGVAFEYPPTLELISPGRDPERPITLVDGEAHADAWNQIKADVTGVPIRTTAIRESAALGAAILAGQSVGAFADAADGARRAVRFDRVYEPDQPRHDRYGELREHYRGVLDAIRPLFHAAGSHPPASHPDPPASHPNPAAAHPDPPASYPNPPAAHPDPPAGYPNPAATGPNTSTDRTPQRTGGESHDPIA